MKKRLLLWALFTALAIVVPVVKLALIARHTMQLRSLGWRTAWVIAAKTYGWR